ncbi:hypothetical protein XBP1_2750004 [Xenorhabdus bovienii str. puntauvense]|uniref:Uncharacterized protein n=1 Tax=Xenorhabdus bovienii str. puntauvense TaxID=1398201 RepID=A0A077NIQ0_XENBV|nr:hypothetical protein XBP1_2750004 [Xenorhabdus bovienii str. puntauvense]
MLYIIQPLLYYYQDMQGKIYHEFFLCESWNVTLTLLLS